MHKLYRIELETQYGTDIYYEYGDDKTDALAQCLTKYEHVDIRLREVHLASPAELLDAAKG